MATVNFSVPEEVKQAFNTTFEGQNKSAVIANLMRDAVEAAQRKKRSDEAIQHILERRQQAPILSEQEIQSVREEERP